jgi:hypothetical protein
MNSSVPLMDRCIGNKEIDRGQIYEQIGILLELAQIVPLNSATAIDALS